MTASAAGQQNVADHHYLFRFRRNSLQSEPRAHDPFVHRSAMRQRGFFAMIDDRNSERPRIFERRSHELGTHHRPAIVAHCNGARANHLAELGQHLAPLADGYRADRMNARRCGAVRLTNDEADRSLIVRHRICIRHRAHCREAAGRRGPCATRDRLDVFPSRLSQMAVNIDEARRHDAFGAVDDFGVVGQLDAPADRFDYAGGYENVTDFVYFLRRIEDPSAGEKNRSHAASGLSGAPLLRCPPPFAASASSGLPPESR